MDEIQQNTCSWYDPSCALEWLRDEFQAFGVWILDSLLSAVAGVFEAIPTPDFMADVGIYSLPPSVSWAISVFQVDVGIGIIVSAYTARFILKRIPIIG
jgi:hypothetical protein